MVNTIKFSQFSTVNLNDATNQIVGYGSGVNFQGQKVITWTTGTRPSSPVNGLLGYDTTLSQYEYWDAGASDWIPLAGGAVGTVTEVDTGTGLTGGPITSSGTISFAAIAQHSLWANTTGSTAVPTVTPLSTFLLSANNLSDLTNAGTARTNLGLAIGVNVEAWSPLLDEIAAGTWPGAASITTLGTIATGVWHGSDITVPFGGTGNSTFTAYAIICAGTSSTAPFQNVSGVGTSGQILTSNGSGALPTWQSVAGTGTVSPGLINEVAWYAASGDTISGLSTIANGTLITSSGSVPSISQTLPNAVQSNITALGTVTSGVWQGTVVAMAFGGTGANLVPTVNNLVYSTSSTMALLPTGDNGVLITSASGVPSISSTLPAAVQNNITSVGTITSGTWNGTGISVPFGGTGLSSTNVYALLCGGTTSTGALQQVSGVGLTGQILTSNGTGALPTWQNVTGTGTVNSGTINDLAYYAATGTTISGLPTANSSTLITSVTGVPSLSQTLPIAVQTNITELGTITVGIWNSTNQITVPFGGTGSTTFTAYSVICAGTTATGNFQNVTGVGSTGQVLTSNGAGALPTWQSATGTGTVNSSTQNYIGYYAANGNTISGLTTANNSTLVTNGSGVPSIGQTLPNAVQENITALGTVTIGVWEGTLIALAFGGTNANLTASNGGIVWSNSTEMQILAGTTTARQLLLSGSSATPSWSTSTYPTTNAVNTLLWASSANVMAALATANSSILVTNSSGVPAWGTTLPGHTVAGNITFSPTTDGIVGTTTNDNAATGNVGEIISSSITSGSATSLSNGVAKNVTSISISAGDWDVYGNVFFTASIGGTSYTAWISSTTATQPDLSLVSSVQGVSAGALSSAGIVVPFVRVSVASSTTYFLSALSDFTTGTVTACGNIFARRAR
jgi:hypothetical protein